MNILHSNLETVKAPRLCGLDLNDEVAPEVFIDDTIRRSEESKDVRNKVAFIVGEGVPVIQVAGEVDFFGGPEGGLGLFVHLPYLQTGGAGGKKGMGERYLITASFRRRPLPLSEVGVVEWGISCTPHAARRCVLNFPGQ